MADLRFLRARELGTTAAGACPSHAQSAALIRRLKLAHRIREHSGCVNTAVWTDDGRHVITGSDDRRVCITDMRTRSRLLKWDTGHRGNVFCAQLLAHSLPREGARVITCAADGAVRLHSVMSDTSVSARLLGRHRGRAHKLAIRKGDYDVVVSAGEDGVVMLYDVRADGPQAGVQLFTMQSASRSRALQAVEPVMARHSINICAFSPRHPCHLLVGGDDPVVRVYDIRAVRRGPAVRLCPQHMRPHPRAVASAPPVQAHVTGAQWSYDGARIVATYNDEHIYIFGVDDSVDDAPGDAVPPSRFWRAHGAASVPFVPADENDVRVTSPADAAETAWTAPRAAPSAPGEFQAASYEYTYLQSDEVSAAARCGPGVAATLRDNEPGGGTYMQRLRGHRNNDTVKGVSWFGRCSDFVVSGCDTGHLFIYDASTGAIVNMIRADSHGAVNCLSPHPSGATVLLTSGLDSDAKLWIPQDEVTLKADDVSLVVEQNDHERASAEDAFSPASIPSAVLLRLLMSGQLRSVGSTEDGGAFAVQHAASAAAVPSAEAADSGASAAAAEQDGEDIVLTGQQIMELLWRARGTVTASEAEEEEDDGDESESDSGGDDEDDNGSGSSSVDCGSENTGDTSSASDDARMTEEGT